VSGAIFDNTFDSGSRLILRFRFIPFPEPWIEALMKEDINPVGLSPGPTRKTTLGPSSLPSRMRLFPKNTCILFTAFVAQMKSHCSNSRGSSRQIPLYWGGQHFVYESLTASIRRDVHPQDCWELMIGNMVHKDEHRSVHWRLPVQGGGWRVERTLMNMNYLKTRS